MALIRSRKFWVLALCAGGVLAAATAGSLVFLEKDAPAHAPAQQVAVAKAQGGEGDGCGYPDQVIVEGAGGPSGGWSYFGTGVPVTVGGSISYLCQGKPAGGYTSQFWMAVTCDGAPLNVQYDDAPGETWSASFTSPTTQSVCSMEIRADTAGGASGETDETFVFLTDPGTAPTISMTNPLSGTIVHPDEIAISAQAGVSSPHAITKVQFFDASNLNPEGQIALGTREQMPFELTGVTLKPAIHLIYAIATDSRGYQAMSQRALLQVNSNQAPHVKVRSPIAGTKFPTPATIAIIADVTDPDPPIGPPGGIKRISIHAGTTLLDEVVWRTGPVSEHREFSWQNPPVGQHEIYVETEDQRGATRRVGPVPITVTADATPTAKVTAPVDGQFQVPNSAITLSASASDDRVISQIDFVVAPWPGTTGQVIVTGVAPVASALYRNTWTSTSSWTPAVAGRYVIRARVKDGAARPVVDSDAVEVYVDDNGSGNFVPSVRIVKPVNSDGVRLGALMPIAVNVQDGTGETGIDAVDVFLDNATTPLWSLTRTPGANTWAAAGVLTASMPEGAHTLLARARDGGVGSAFRGDSPRVAFTVLASGANPAPVASIELPARITSLAVNTATTLSVTARDVNVDGTISTIEIFSNGELISPALVLSPVAGRPNEKTTTMSWTPTAAGDYDLLARVKDNANLLSDSPLLKIRVTAVAGNAPPNIAFNLPENGSDFELMPGGSVTLRVAVNDPAAAAGGTPGISAVDFFDGATRIGTVNSGFPSGIAQTTATFNWLNPSEGSHGLTARARDSQGSVTFASPINVFILGGPPTVSIISPVAGHAGFIAPENIWTMVNVEDDSGRISKVEYFLDDIHKGESAVAPFDFQFQDVGAGSHVLTARAWDFGLHSTLSAPVNITVAPNQLPTISITAPVSGSQFGEGSHLTLEAAVNDPDEQVVKKVEYLVNNVVVSTAVYPPFRGTWINAPAGLAQNLSARVTDKRGGIGSTLTATVVNVIAARPPTLSFPSPVLPGSDDLMFVGEQVSLAAQASDPDASFGGLITHVDFFRHFSGPGGQAAQELIVSDTTAPYAASWVATTASISQGNSTFSVKAFDNGPVGNGPTPRNMTAAGSTVSVRILAQNRAPSNVRFHPHIPASRWLPMWGAAIALPATPSNYQHGVLHDHIPAYRVQSNGRVTLCAYADDADGNVAGIKFYLTRPSVQSDVLLKTATIRSAANSFCALRVPNPAEPGNSALDTTLTGFATELDLSATHADTGVQYIRAEAFDSRGLTATTAVDPDPGQPGYVPCFGERFSPGDRSQLGSACVKYSVPVAISNPTAITSACGNGTDGATPTCAANRFALPSALDAVSVLQAERYDAGGQGLGMFEKTAAGPSLRPDHDQARIWCANGVFNAGCTLRGFDNGEFRRYSVTMPAGNSTSQPPGGNVVYTVRFKPSTDVYLSQPKDGLYLDQELYTNQVGTQQLRFKAVNIVADMFGHLVGGAANSKLQVEYFTRPVGTTGPGTPRGTTGPIATDQQSFQWRPGGSTPVRLEVAARSKLIFRPGTADEQQVTGELSEWRTVNWVLNGQIPLGALTTQDEFLPPEQTAREGIKGSGEFESLSTTLCPSVFASAGDGWFTEQSCSIGLPANDYYFNLSSDMDGKEVDSIEFRRTSDVSGDASIALTAPTTNSQFATGADVNLRATFNGASNQSTLDFKVTRYQPVGDPLTVQSSGYPQFHAVWRPTVAGRYGIKALGKLVPQSAPTESEEISVIVEGAITNPPPQVTLTNPSANLTLQANSSLQLTMTATDDGSIMPNLTQFLIAKDGAAPQSFTAIANGGSFSFNWTPTLAGSYAVSASATDNLGVNTTTSTRTVTVQGGIITPPAGHDIPAAIPTSISPYSDGVGATAGQFRVDESGAATYSIALLAAPGRAGVQPQMSLNYSSQGGTGPMGKGWSIGGLSGISRCREAFELGDASATTIVDGEEISAGSRPVDFSINDRFCLDGQRLVLISGAYGVHGSEYRTEMDQFARIRLFDVDAIPGPNYFVVQRKDGSTAWYGDRISFTGLAFGVGATESLRPEAYLDRNHNIGSGALIVPPPGTEPAISWAMTRTMDSSGNYIDYRYSKNAAIGEQLLSEVQFTGRTKLVTQVTPDQQTFASIRFDYSVLPDNEQSASYQSGMLSQLTRRLNKVVSLSGAQVLRTYNLTYTPIVIGLGISGLTELSECAPVDPIQPNGAQVCYPATRFTWSQAQVEMPKSHIRDAYNFQYHKSSKLGDINGDGRMDLVIIEENEPRELGGRLCLAGGNSKRVVRVFYSKSVTAPEDHPSARTLDFRHSAVAEACIDVPLNGPDGEPNDNSNWMLFDFNGDGRDDLMVADRSDDAVDGSDWGSNGRWDRWHIYPAGEVEVPEGTVPPAFDTSTDLLPACTAMGDGEHCVPVSPLGPLAQLADVNGDGLPDVLYGRYNYAQALDGFRVRLLQRVANPVAGAPSLRYSSDIPVTIEWKGPAQPWSREEFPCDRPEGTNLSVANGSSADPGLHFSHCSIGVGDPSFRRGRGPTVAEFNGDGSADLLTVVSHVTLQMEVTATLPHECDDPDRSTETGLALAAGETYLHHGAADEAPWRAHSQRVLSRTPTQALCHTATHYTQFQYQLVVDRIAPVGDATYPNGAVVYKEYGRNQTGYAHVNKYGQEPGASDLFLNEAHMADFNGDGLTDLLFSDYRASAPDPNSTVVQYLNLGTRMQSDSEAEQREGDDLIERKLIYVFDVNGDGRDDLVLPGGTNAPDVSCRGFFVERRTEKDGRLPVADNGCAALGKIPTGEINNWARFFSDFDGDGTTDHAAWQIFSSNGGGGGQAGGRFNNLITASSQDCGRGSICANGGGSRHRAKHVIRSITNGYGTKTHIQYDPLTNGAVYRRAQNSRSLVNTGRGTAVQDLGGAIYVVSKVESDAPTADDPNATSKLYYQYADARIQGGGRGNLGFAEIRTIDPNFSDQHVVSISKYSQAYPFTGMPKETRKVGVAGAYTAPACVEQSLEAGADCFSSLGQPSLYFFEPLGKLLSYARNLYAANDTYPGVVHPYIAASFEVTGNPEADSAGIQTLTTAINYFEFDGYGNATSTDSYVAKGRSYANLTALRDAADSVYNEASGLRGAPCATGCVKHTRTEELTYADDTVNWRIGRLTASTVRHTRYSAAGAALPTKTRRTAFTYYMDGARTGLLKTQTLQPGRGGSEEMRSINFYDDYGNSIGSMQCSSDVVANDCDDPSDFGKVLQRTKGANDAPLYRVHRYSRSTMSVGINSIDGRYAVGGFAPFFNDSASSANQVLELSTGQVLASDRDALGNVKYATDAHGVWASATFGPMGRGQTSATQSGGKSASEFHWCAPMPNNNGPVAACPSGAVFRQTSYTLGGARSITFFDKLGRAYFAVTEGFNADVVGSASNSHWSGACTGYDTRGRVVRATNPFYVNVNGATSPPTLLENTSCVAGVHAETRTTYDYLDRVTEILMPEHTTSEPASTHNVFAGLLTTTRVSVYRDGDSNGSEEAVELIKEEWTDASGMKVSVRAQDTLITNYAYDSVDQLTALTRQASAGSNVITSTMVYDDLGRKTEQSDPDAGIVRYAYNAAGEMICSEDARGIATVTDYDALGRAWRVSSGRPAGSCALPAPAAQTVSATDVPTVGTGASRSIDLTLFDTIQRGLVTKVTRVQTTGDSGAGYGSVDTYVQAFVYDDPLARLTSTVTTISPVAGGTAEPPFVQSLTYDGLGRVATTTDATGGRVENMYSSRGFLRRVRDAAAPATVYWELLASNERGQATRERRHGDARISTRRDYDALTGRLQAILSGFDSGSTFVNPVQNLSYQYDMLGNLRSRTDLSLNLRERFVYDKLDRLVTGYATGINGNAAAFNTADLSYDRIGNICAKDGLGYTYAGAAGCGLDLLLGAAQNLAGRSPHAATRRALASGQFVEYGYDLAGNQILADDPNGVVKDRRIRFNADGLADRIAVGDSSAPSSVSSFRYGAGGRYLRIDKVGSVETVTRYVGGVEWITKTNAVEERKRYIGGSLILTETGAPSALSKTYRYILGDHLGSLDTLVDQYGDVIEKLSFDPHGNRRAASSNGVWNNLLGSYTASNTTHGFTGHEHVDLSNIIHMNGRLYDPVLGRMLSADPIIQAPFNAQNLNRYTYVLNNPLSLTDPTGLSWLNDNWRSVAAVAITVVATVICVATCTSAVAAAAVAVTSGAAAGGVASASTEGAVQGAFSAAVFFGVGQYFQGLANSNFYGPVSAQNPAMPFLTTGQTAAKVLSHAIAGGVMSELGGGKFGNGFLSAGVTQALSGKIDAIPGGQARIVTAAMVGGTVSAATGGKFANGALTAAFSRAFNEENHRNPTREEMQERRIASLNIEDYDRFDDSFHEYQITSTLCTAGPGCSVASLALMVNADSAPRFGNMTEGYNVLHLNNPIIHTTYFDTDGSYFMMNATYFLHDFHAGAVVSRLFEAGGSVLLDTHGFGYSSGWAAKMANYSVGYSYFPAWHAQVVSTAKIQSGQIRPMK